MDLLTTCAGSRGHQDAGNGAFCVGQQRGDGPVSWILGRVQHKQKLQFAICAHDAVDVTVTIAL